MEIVGISSCKSIITTTSINLIISISYVVKVGISDNSVLPLSQYYHKKPSQSNYLAQFHFCGESVNYLSGFYVISNYKTAICLMMEDVRSPFKSTSLESLVQTYFSRFVAPKYIRNRVWMVAFTWSSLPAHTRSLLLSQSIGMTGAAESSKSSLKDKLRE